eukprot:TRINITY_DN3980_c0_g1_i1.p2 TRINITY_DN3980_c0_g1~~TRINITY_DN3980_c0_g1_i1.p2  ORF type:complete len:931 (-),score=96.96 TRINITY_DN3980_c0_g1_i1:86-2878(-)
MDHSERIGLVAVNRRSFVVSSLPQRSKSVGQGGLNSIHPTLPSHQLVPSLKFLATAAIISILEQGFTGIQKAGTVPKEAREVRGRLFNYDARKILKTLEKEPILAQRILQDMAPTSTAIYCAMVAVSSIDAFEISHHAGRSAFNRSLDTDSIKLINSAWRNLRRLSLKGARVDSDFLNTLASGAARSTLQVLDVSATLVTDADLEPIALFDDLRELQINQCPYLTKRTLHRICCFGETLEILGINSSEIPVPVILDTVAGAPSSDPLPKLKELHMESESWSKYMNELQDFLQRRKNLSQLRVWAVVPKLDFQNASAGEGFLKMLVTKCPVQRLYLSESNLEIVKISHHLRELHLQVGNIVQSQVDVIGSNCQLLRSLTISSACLCNQEGLRFDGWRSLQDFRLIDATLGKLCSLPPNLTKISATIASISTEAASVQLISSICHLKELKGLNLMTSQGSMGQVYLPIQAFNLILTSLPALEDLVLDRGLFGGSSSNLDNPIRIPIVHNTLKSIKLLCSVHDSIVPYVKSAPNLVSFESTNLDQSVSSLASITARSPNIRSLQLCLETPLTMESARATSTPNPNYRAPSPDHQRPSQSDSQDSLLSSSRERRSSLPKLDLTDDGLHRGGRHRADKKVNPISGKRLNALKSANHYQLANVSYQLHSIRFLTEISIDGAAESVAARLPHFRHLHRIRFAKCQLSDALLLRLKSDLKSMRDLDLERCKGVSCVDSLKGSQLARISIRSCPDFVGPININGSDFPNLEVINLGQLYFVSTLVLYNLPQLRWVTLSNIESPSVINVSDVPRLYDIAFDNVSSTKIRVHSSGLCRLYIDCGQSFDSESTSEEGDGGASARNAASIHLKVPNLEKFSWQGEDIPIDVAMHVVTKTPKLQQFEMPSTSSEDVEPFKALVRESCPLLKVISCGDGEVPLSV